MKFKKSENLAFDFSFLAEQGQATESSDSWEIQDEIIPILDEVEREQLRLPPSWRHSIKLKTKSTPSDYENFEAWLEMQIGDRPPFTKWETEGPLLKVGGEDYLLSSEQLTGIQALQKWEKRSYSNEVTHLRMLMELGISKNDPTFDTSSAGSFDILEPSTLVIAPKREIGGDLTLVPLPILKSSEEIIETGLQITEEEINKIEERSSQLSGSSKEAVLRIDGKMVVLSEEQTVLARRVFDLPPVPADQANDFLDDPTSWLDKRRLLEKRAHEPEIEIPYMPRVVGIGIWKPIYVGSSSDDGEEQIEWIQEPEDATPPTKTKDNSDPSQGKKENQTEDSPEKPETVTHLFSKNGDEVRFGKGWNSDKDAFIKKRASEIELNLDELKLKRTPRKHQDEAIRLMMAHTERIPDSSEDLTEENCFGAGLLVADDMGLGKTATSLFFIQQWWNQVQQANPSQLPKAALIVAPLSVMNEWQLEIEKTFQTDSSPFGEIIVAHRSEKAFINKFSAFPLSDKTDSTESGEFKEVFGLPFGPGSDPRIDEPGSLVITNYDNLRRCRFSFSKCEWSTVILDEAHALKNPEAQQTIAAKALKADFRIALTGTPVENRLSDLWSIMDFVEPDALGLWKEFKARYLKRTNDTDEETNASNGAELRKYLGSLILRRLKQEVLGRGDIPPKEDTFPTIPMTAEQAVLYDDIRNLKVTGDNAEAPWLTALWELRRISLHPDLTGGGHAISAQKPRKSRDYLAKAGKTNWLLSVLDQIKAKKEKVIIFAVQKNFQRLLRDHLSCIYGIPIGIINGDTKTKSATLNLTRGGMIQDFTGRFGEPDEFKILILSPVAAGAGLNIQAANHVIHMERHWNPAKEDQATGRAWRLGSKKKVHVYFPILVAPSSQDFATFDQNLNRHIQRKRNITEDVGFAAVSTVSERAMAEDSFSQSSEGPSSHFLALEDVLGLTGHLFEAFVAECYAHDGAHEVFLTPKSGDGGADIVVLGYGPNHDDLLIECKSTQDYEKKFNSGREIRTFQGAKTTFDQKFDTHFSLVFHASHRALGRNAKEALRTNDIEGHGRKWITSKLKEHKIKYSDLMSRDSQRSSGL